MSINTVEMQDNSGNVYYPHTDASVVKFGDSDVGTSLSDNTKVINPVDDTGTANTYVITLSNAPTTYAKYQAFRFVAKTSNTGASTLNVNGLGAKSLVKDVNIPLVTGDILTGQIVTTIYDGTNFQIVPDYSTQFANAMKNGRAFLANGTDLNTVTTGNGDFPINGTYPNSPVSGVISGLLQVDLNTGAYNMQRLYLFRGSIQPRIFVRMYSSSWSAWIETTITSDNYLMEYRSTSLSIPNNAKTIVPFDVLTSDSNSALSTNGGETITLPAGAYIINAKATFVSNSTGYREITFNNTDGTFIAGWQQSINRENANTSTDTTLEINRVINISSTQTFALYVYQNSGGALNLYSGDNNMSLTVRRIL